MSADVVVKHLLAARAELAMQRLRIDRDIEGLDRMIAERAAGQSSDTGEAAPDSPAAARDESTTRRTSAGQAPLTVRDAIVMLLNSETRDWHLDEIVSAVRALGVDAKEASVRSVMSRVVKDKQAVKGSSGRSSYRAAPVHSGSREDVDVPTAANEVGASVNDDDEPDAPEQPGPM